MEHRRILHPQPGGEHATVGSSKDINRSARVLILRIVVVAAIFFNLHQKSHVVLHDLLNREVLQVLLFKCLGLVAEWEGLTVVSVLSEDDGAIDFLG